MEHKTIKYLIAIGFFIGFILFLCAPVFAFEGFEVDAIPFWYNDASYSQTYYQFANDDSTYMVGDFYHSSSQTEQGKEVGIVTGFPVPYYSDGDHYSVFLNFAFSVPSAAHVANDWVGIYVRPMTSNGLLTPASGGSWLKVNVNNITPGSSTGFTDLSYGTFQWQGYANCSYRMLIVSTVDNDNTQYIYNVSCVLDLNLISKSGVLGDELRPFSISAKYYLGYPQSSTSTYGLGLYKNYSIRCTDTSVMGVLENIQSAIEDLDFSGLSGLADMSATVTNLYNSYVTNSGIEIGLMESIIDDGETDAEPIQWESQAQEMQSQVQELHSLEEDIKGTFTEYEFPTAPNQTAIGNVANMFFQNELFIALTLAFFTMTLCMMFLF